MHADFNAQDSEPFAAGQKQNDHRVVLNSSAAAGGFNTWWQKTEAQNMATVTEGYDLMRAHNLASTARRLGAQQAH